MPAVNFPNSPTIGQTHTANGKSWQYDGSRWLALGGGGGGGGGGGDMLKSVYDTNDDGVVNAAFYAVEADSAGVAATVPVAGVSGAAASRSGVVLQSNESGIAYWGRRITHGTSAPSSPASGDIWLDTTT